ncbi:hypothetical protein YC2023_082628 [Brassica napus]
MERHRSPLIVSDMIHTRDEVSSTQDFLIAGNSKIFEIETQRSPLIGSSMIKPRDEVSSTQDLLIPQSSNILELNSYSKKTMNDVENMCGDMHIKYLNFLRSGGDGA